MSEPVGRATAGHRAILAWGLLQPFGGRATLTRAPNHGMIGSMKR